jgi:hypothetical protein
MTERAGLKVDTLTIRIPIRLQRRSGRKMIMTPEGVAAPARKPSRDETLVKALVRAHRWRRRIEGGGVIATASPWCPGAGSARSRRAWSWSPRRWRRCTPRWPGARSAHSLISTRSCANG